VLPHFVSVPASPLAFTDEQRRRGTAKAVWVAWRTGVDADRGVVYCRRNGGAPVRFAAAAEHLPSSKMYEAIRFGDVVVFDLRSATSGTPLATMTVRTCADAADPVVSQRFRWDGWLRAPTW
jgi:hypothetical protein